MKIAEMPKHIELAYKDALDNIQFLKKQQWVIVGYAVSIHVGVFAVCRELKPSPTWRCLLIVAIWFAVAYGIVVLIDFHAGISKFRQRLKWIYQHHFTKQEQKELLNLGEDGQLDSDRSPREPWFHWGLCATLVISGVIASGAVWFVPGQ